MRYFVFYDWHTAEIFEWLMLRYPERVKEWMQSAMGEAADAHVEHNDADDWRDGDEMVFERLETKVREWVEQEACHYCEPDGPGIWNTMIWNAVQTLNLRDIAKAIYNGVEPNFDPHVREIPEVI